jgi:hypothetical protein
LRGGLGLGIKIYVASSWRNKEQPYVVEALKMAGHHVYDFRHPIANDDGFHWSEIDENWQSWDVLQLIYRKEITTRIRFETIVKAKQIHRNKVPENGIKAMLRTMMYKYWDIANTLNTYKIQRSLLSR